MSNGSEVAIVIGSLLVVRTRPQAGAWETGASGFVETLNNSGSDSISLWESASFDFASLRTNGRLRFAQDERGQLFRVSLWGL